MREIIFDCETGGLDAKKHALLTIAGYICVDNMPLEEFSFKMRPVEGKIIEDEALKVNGLKREDIMTWDDPKEVYIKMHDLLSKYKWKWNKDKKKYFKAVGYNSPFDLDFLLQWFIDNGDNYLFCFIDPKKTVDIWKTVVGLHHLGKIADLENYKLATVAKEYGITFTAHDALEDVRATMKVIEKLKILLGG